MFYLALVHSILGHASTQFLLVCVCFNLWNIWDICFINWFLLFQWQAQVVNGKLWYCKLITWLFWFWYTNLFYIHVYLVLWSSVQAWFVYNVVLAVRVQSNPVGNVIIAHLLWDGSLLDSPVLCFGISAKYLPNLCIRFSDFVLINL